MGYSRRIFNFCSSFFDSFTVTVIGPDDSYSGVITSVNIVGEVDSVPVNVPGMTGEDHTGWTSISINITNFGSPITISFALTDVGDTAYSSAVFVDNIHLD